jgi:flavodoxin
MKTLIIYYSFGGSTRAEAKRLAAENPEAVLCEVKEEKKRGLLRAFFPGCKHALRRKASRIKPPEVDLKAFDRIIIGSPIWAGYPAPAWNAIVNLLPGGREVELFFCSGGGESPKSKQGSCGIIAGKGCRLLAYRDVKSGG